MISIGLKVAVISLLVFGVLFWLWPRKGKIGINTKTVHCPRCGLKAPMVRKPESARQIMWGGWTCQTYDCEFDKYGNELST
jgi:hypothetical protein